MQVYENREKSAKKYSVTIVTKENSNTNLKICSNIFAISADIHELNDLNLAAEIKHLMCF